MHIEQRLEFLDSLPTVAAPAKPSIRLYSAQAPIDPNKESATVGEEMINLFAGGISEQNRKDVNNCKTLVQNAATKLYDPIKDLYQWYKYYIDTMAKLGWITQAFQVKDQIIKRSGLTMDIVAIHVMQGLVGANAQKLLESANRAVNGVKNNQGLIDIYNRKSNIGSDAKFDISPVWQTKEGYPMMILNCNTLDVRESSRGILFWKSTTQETRIKTAAQAVYLNLDVYDQVRNGVLKKLGRGAEEALGDIPDF